MSKLKNFIKELQDRKVFRVASVYAVTMWILIQGATDMFPVFDLPVWGIRLLVVIAIIGLPIAIILAWAYEMTREGVVRDDGAKNPHSANGRFKVDYIVIGALVILLGFFVMRDRIELLPDETEMLVRQENEKVVSELSNPILVSHPQSIAVLPFVNMSSDEEVAYFSDGMTEEILNVLSNIPGLRVASRTSSFAFKGSQADIPTVAGKLGVSFVLEGSVRRSQNMIRITAQLIDAREDIHVWSETYDREMMQVFEVQDEISAAIVDKLKPAVFAARGGKPKPSSRTDSIEAYEEYLKGRSVWNPQSAEALLESVAFLEKSIELDPNFARSHSALARTLLSLSEIADEKETYRSRAFSSAKMALRLDNRLRESHEILKQKQ